MATSRMLAFLGTDHERLPCAMDKLREDLSIAPGVGYGVAHYTDDALLLNRRPGVDVTGQSFTDLVGGLKTRVLIAHSFPEGLKTTPASDLQPFKFRQWAVAISGITLGEDAQNQDLRSQLLEGVPDFIERDIRGQSCAEAWAHRLFWQLHHADLLKDGQDPLRVAKVLRQTLEEFKTLAIRVGRTSPKLNVLMTDGLRVFVMRDGPAVVYKQRDGIVDCRLCYNETDQNVPFGLRESHQRFRAFVIALEAEGFDQSWTQVDPGAVLIFDRNMEITHAYSGGQLN